MKTVIIAVTESYVLVGSLGLWFALQNIGNTHVVAVLSDVAPADTDEGFELSPGDGMTPGNFGDENLYVRVKSGAGLIAITK